MGDQPVASPLPTHGTTQTHTDIHALSGIRTQDPSPRASKDSSCLRPHAHCDWLKGIISGAIQLNIVQIFLTIGYDKIMYRGHRK
jgi:hypothetical protein